jgi:hypothetical protein
MFGSEMHRLHFCAGNHPRGGPGVKLLTVHLCRRSSALVWWGMWAIRTMFGGFGAGERGNQCPDQGLFSPIVRILEVS